MISKFVYAVVLAGMASVPVQAEWQFDTAGKRAGLYLCTLSMGGGVDYRAATDTWASSTFRTSEAFVFSLKLIEEIREGHDFEQEFTKDRVGLYSASLKYAGTDMSEPCDGEGAKVRVDDYGSFRCTTGIAEYRINFTNLKFLSISYADYLGDNLDGTDQDSSLLAGSCTKVD